ncbi:hypothetical protein ISCGN_009342 [Ixodes scapularis]
MRLAPPQSGAPERDCGCDPAATALPERCGAGSPVSLRTAPWRPAWRRERPMRLPELWFRSGNTLPEDEEFSPSWCLSKRRLLLSSSPREDHSVHTKLRLEAAAAGAMTHKMGKVQGVRPAREQCISTTVDVKVTWKAWGYNIVNQDIRPSVAVKNLTIALGGSSVLLQRTVTEVASNASLNKDSRLPLTPKKVTFLRVECKLSHVNVT